MKRYLPFLALSLLFFLIKVNGIGVRISDSNIYFYTAYKLLDGSLLYRDIFFTNFPILPYVSSIYFILTGGNLSFYTFTPVFEVIAAGFVIYKILLEKKISVANSLTAVGLYFFSFVTLATSDHQTGVFLASVFALCAYYFSTHKKYIIAGVFMGLAIMTKAYFLPIFLALSVVIFLEDKKRSLLYFVTFALCTFLVLLPFLIFAPNEIYNNIFEYSLTRAQGVSKLAVVQFFAIHDVILLILFFYSIIRIKKDLFFGLLSILGLVFVLLYKDVYYLYLNFIVPFLCLGLPKLSKEIEEKFDLPKSVIPMIVFCVLILNVLIYLSSYQTLQKIENIEEITDALGSLENKYIYGTNDIAPALAYLSNKEMVSGIIDTNENIFMKGFLNGRELTREAVGEGALIVSHGMYYPQYNIDYPILGEMFDPDLITKSCERKISFPVRMEGQENRVVVFSC